MTRSVIAGIVLLLAVVTAGCTSAVVMVAPQPPAKYEVLGPAEGSATGGLYLLATAYNFIPIGLNDRVDRAYKDAVESVPGATGLINVSIQESWFWIVLGTLRTSTIRGDAIRGL